MLAQPEPADSSVETPGGSKARKARDKKLGKKKFQAAFALFGKIDNSYLWICEDL